MQVVHRERRNFVCYFSLHPYCMWCSSVVLLSLQPLLALMRGQLPDLMRRSETLDSEIKSLDTDMQALVYRNYSKFIHATDVIKASIASGCRETEKEGDSERKRDRDRQREQEREREWLALLEPMTIICDWQFGALVPKSVQNHPQCLRVSSVQYFLC